MEPASKKINRDEEIQKEKSKIDWKRILIAIGAIILTALLTGAATWSVMEKNARSRQDELKNQTDKNNSNQSEIKKTGSEITKIDSIWNLYTNYDKGYSVKLPASASNPMGFCEWITANGDNSYRPKEVMVPVKVFEKDGVVIIGFEYNYELTGETAMPNGTTRFSKCGKVENTFETLNDSEGGIPWRIRTADANNETDINAFFKRYGETCESGDRKKVADGLYQMAIKGDGLDLGLTKCPVNYATSIFYSEKTKRIYYWDLGQSCGMPGANYSNCYDEEMVSSFKVL